MGLKPLAQAVRAQAFCCHPHRCLRFNFHNMAPMKKAVGKAMTKGAIAEAIATEFEIKKNVAGKIVASLAELGAKRSRRAASSPSQAFAGSRPGSSQPQRPATRRSSE